MILAAATGPAPHGSGSACALANVDRVPTHDVDYPFTSFEPAVYRGAKVIQVHPQRCVPYSQRCVPYSQHCKRIWSSSTKLPYPKLVQTSTFQANEPALLPCSEIIPSIDLRLDTDQRVEPLFGWVNSE